MLTMISRPLNPGWLSIHGELVCIYLRLFCCLSPSNSAVTRSQFKLFDIPIYPSPRTANVQQKRPKQTLTAHFCSWRRSGYCFTSSFVYLFYRELVLCFDESHISHRGEEKSSKPRPRTLMESVTQPERDSCNNIRLERERRGEEGVKTAPRERRRRGGQRGSIFIWAESCLSLNGGKEEW